MPIKCQRPFSLDVSDAEKDDKLRIAFADCTAVVAIYGGSLYGSHSFRVDMSRPPLPGGLLDELKAARERLYHHEADVRKLYATPGSIPVSATFALPELFVAIPSLGFHCMYNKRSIGMWHTEVPIIDVVPYE